jgi:hypothetical protein
MNRPLPSADPAFEHHRFSERPDGIHWEDTQSGESSGPFATIEEAIADIEILFKQDAVAKTETLEETEDEIGIASWIDPETGQPAEESIPHIEEH